MNHLRQKIELDPHKPELLVTETRVGYRLNMKTPMATQINNPSVTPPVGDEGQTDKLEGLDPTLY
jgi:hypothetical protein